MIEISKMGFRYSGSSHMALHDVDLTIRDGEFVGLIGVSGAVSAQVRGFSLRARGAGYKEYPFCLGGSAGPAGDDRADRSAGAGWMTGFTEGEIEKREHGLEKDRVPFLVSSFWAVWVRVPFLAAAIKKSPALPMRRAGDRCFLKEENYFSQFAFRVARDSRSSLGR